MPTPYHKRCGCSNAEVPVYDLDRLRAEDDLDWYFSVAPTLLDLGANPMDPDAGGGKGWQYNDRQIAAATRARPIRRALIKLSGRDQTVLKLRFEPCGYPGTDAADYLHKYDKYAAVVRHFRDSMKRMTDAQRKARADDWVGEAVRGYMLAMATLEAA